jgi:hypothetical protein
MLFFGEKIGLLDHLTVMRIGDVSVENNLEVIKAVHWVSAIRRERVCRVVSFHRRKHYMPSYALLKEEKLKASNNLFRKKLHAASAAILIAAETNLQRYFFERADRLFSDREAK